MKLLPLFLIGPALGASAAEARRGQPGRGGEPVPADCPLTIGFASYAMGIDMPSYRAVRQLLSADRAVRAVSEHRWGREGEVTLCARARSRAEAERLFHAVRRLVPARPRGPVALRTRSGLSFDAPGR